MAERSPLDDATDLLKATTGFYPHLKRNRTVQNPQAAKNVPVDLARGFASGVLGAPGDIESLVRMLPYLDENTVLPTSEDIEKRLPFKSDTPVSRAATGLGQLTGGFYNGPASPLRVIGALPKAIKHGAEEFAKASVAGAPHVIKPAGGNWFGTSVQDAMSQLRQGTGYSDPAENLKELRQRYTPEALANMQEGNRNFVLNSIKNAEKDVALNKWIDSNLTNYIKKQMATPEDPVRKLAEEGIVHIPTSQVGINRYKAPKHREQYGGQQLGQSEAARAWEDASDVAINAPKVELLQAPNFLRKNPWIEKLPMDQQVYALNNPASHQQEITGLGFDHIIDVLREDIAYGRIRPEQLNKVSMEQAVRRTYEYDQEMAKKMRETALKQQEGFPLHKEYPEGYKWIELAPNAEKGQQLKELHEKMRQAAKTDDPSFDSLNEQYKAAKKELEDPVQQALTYEGNTMGHCVGGYCPDVLSGKTRIFSLRDAKGEPHVTIEVGKNSYAPRWDEVKPYMAEAEQQVIKDRIANNLPEATPNELERLTQAYAFQKAKENSPPNIVQIKGKQNAKPKEGYIPYVQDFVKSGNWSDVGDLKNAGLQDVGGVSHDTHRAHAESLGLKLPKYLTEQEYSDLTKNWDQYPFSKDIPESLKKYSTTPPEAPPQGMKRGGVVISNNPDTMLMELGNKRMKEGGSEDDTKPYFGGAGTKKYAAAKKRAEDADVNLLKDPKTYAAMASFMGEAPDELGFSVLHPDYKGVREVADPAFYAGTALGVAPLMKAFKAPTMALGRAGEKYAEKVVPQIMERGGLGADILGGLAQGSRSNVIKPTGKANWLSGTNVHVPEGDMWRFKTQPIAGETPAQRIPHHEELLKDPTLNQDQLDRVKYQLELAKGEAALDKWADSALMGYFKGQLATPDDPVRLFIEKNYANIEAKFAKDQERVAKLAQRAETEIDPRKRANIKRQADAMLVQAKDDRDIAMQNISHLPPEMLREIVLDPKSYIKEERVKAGFPAEGMAITDPAKRWEHQADEAIKVTRAGDIQAAMDLQPKLDKALQDQYAVYQKVNDAFGKLLRDKGLEEEHIESLVKSMPRSDKADSVGMLGDLLDADSKYLKLLDQDRSFPKFAAKDNPFVAKLDPETKMYSGYMGDLGFEHVMDVLRQDLAAERLRPEQLNKLSVEQAVKRTQEYNLDLARKMNAERASARANLPVYKEYPEGYKWVQLNQPGNFAAESQAMGHSVKGYEPSTRHPDWVEGSGNEGSSMYGLGGWDAIKSGRAKVYSLVDSRGAPHTTIEVASGSHPIGYSFKGASRDLPETFEYNRDFDEAFPRPTEEQKQAILARAQNVFKDNPHIERMDAFQMAANEVLGELPAEIRQIKGKGNAKPIADYIPYVQDFVKGGKWTDVRDFHNTDLVKIDPDSDLARKIKESGKDPSPYVSQSELTQLLKEYGNSPPEGMKRGGKVSISKNPDTMMMELRNRKMAPGGLVKGLVKAAKAEPEMMKASEALGKIEGRPLVITQADRTKVGGGFLGGPGFSSLQLTEPEYRAAEAAWGVKTPGVAKMILGGGKKAGDNPVYTTMIGSPTQHQSNQMVFDKLYGDFKKAAKKGGLDPELRDKINDRLVKAVDKEGNPVFPPDIDILDKNFKDIANTFDRRSIAGHLMGGVQVGGKKGQIIDYDKIIRDTTDPALIDVPAGALGNRLFTLSGGIIDRPDLHPAFPTILQGEDLGVSFSPVARDILMKDFIEKTMREKGRTPGVFDYTRGHPPSQLITEDILTEMQKLGLKNGGAVKKAAGGDVTGDDLIIEERPL